MNVIVLQHGGELTVRQVSSKLFPFLFLFFVCLSNGAMSKNGDTLFYLYTLSIWTDKLGQTI